MKERAMVFCKQGYNCSQCIVEAGIEKYGVKAGKEVFDGCSGICNGFGIGNMCSALIGGIILLGIMFPDHWAKVLRLQLLSRFYQKFGSFQCCELACERTECTDILEFVAEVLDELIVEGRKWNKEENTENMK